MKPPEEQSRAALLSSALELDGYSLLAFFFNFPTEKQAAREVPICSASSAALGSFLPFLFPMPVVSQGRVSLISNTSH